MKAVYLREENEYTKQELFSKYIVLNYKELKGNYKRLTTNDVIRFKYVGIIVYRDIVLLIYPKYMKDFDKLTIAAKRDSIREIITAIRKYKTDVPKEYEREESDTGDINGILGIMLGILEDYSTFGLYTKYKDEFLAGNEGEADWERTVSQLLPYYIDDFPLYVEYYGKKSVEDKDAIITKIHLKIVDECIRNFDKWGLGYLFPVYDDLCEDEGIINWNNRDIICELKNEIDHQYDTRKQLLLKLLVTYLRYTEEHKLIETRDLENEYSLYGTRDFAMLWQRACEVAFADVYKEPSLNELYTRGIIKKKPKNGSETIKDLVDAERPLWQLDPDKNTYPSKGTLELDGVSFVKKGTTDYMYIIDAKYYLIEMNNPVEKVPGVGDVSKQYVYQMALDSFIKKQGLKVRNFFIMPTDNSIVVKGSVEMKIFERLLKIKQIKVRQVPAHLVLRSYLNNTSLPLTILD